ncbi:probable serine/threonine-protein kinase SIS8 [Diachasma alloeum]|uniref:probable serine/threonine-protein kinase SIS8 n=1 Tax=Diachasma alloeum TaxID=454923 RepID=UPI000738416F|nr:probable serine/threonine-protein kinase SIS8 [Diachasma alloeum]
MRHVAVDEESPGSSCRRLPATSPEVTNPLPDISPAPHGSPVTYVTGAQTPLSKSPPTPEDIQKNSRRVTDAQIAPERIVSVDKRLPGVSEFRQITWVAGSAGSPEVSNTSNQRSVISTILSVRDKLSGSIGTLGEIASVEGVNTKIKWRSYFRDSSHQDSVSNSIDTDNFPEVDLDSRKDSAVCLEEDEALSRIKETLFEKAFENAEILPSIPSRRIPTVSTASFHKNNESLDEDPPPRKRLEKYYRPRRESSGYSSNLSTFDEDRRNSTTDALQALSCWRERRRSSTKRFTRFGRDDETDRMPTTEIYRKVSTAGIEMPNIEELKEIRDTFQEDLKGLTKLDTFPDIQVPRERRRSAKKSIFDKFDDNETEMCKRISGITVEMPNINEDREPNDIDRTRHLQDTRELSSRLSETTLTGNKAIRTRSTGDAALKNSRVMLGCSTLISPEGSQILKSSEEFRAETGETLDSQKNPEGSRKKLITRSESARHQDETPGSPRSRQRKRVVHQFSSPCSSNPELERIPEKPSENSPPEVASQDSSTIIVVNAVRTSSSSEERNEDDETRSTGREEDQIAQRVLPKSIKVYQLLSTQSEDRGDGEPRLMDRRISLQITRQEEDESPSATLASPEDKRLLHADSVPLLKIPPAEREQEVADVQTLDVRRLSPVRKLSSPGEVGMAQRLLGDNGNVGIRPIYPYCPYSPYGSPQGSPRTRRRPLRESRRVSIDNRQGALQLNQYKLLDNIGQGSFGIVKLAYNEEDETHYAMKILSKKKLMKKAGIFGRMAPGRKGASNPLAKVYREIALLKKLDHPNVVKLVEVLDDPDEDNLYLVFELVQKGEVLQLPTDKPLDEETARKNFRDVVMGVEYLHYQRIVHRDIKPSNLLVDSEGRVKVADLGVSAELRASGELLSGSAGTPAFAAPETTTPGAQYSGTLCDVWSMGVTLYSLVTGRVPWDGSGSIIGVQAAVRSEPLRFPDKPVLSDDLRDLLSHMLAKDPAMRLALDEIKSHRWLTNHGNEPLPSEADNCRLPVTVTDEEVARVVTRVPKLDTLILIKTMLKQHSFQNPFLPRRMVKPTMGDAVPSCLKTAASGNCDGAQIRETMKTRTKQFHKAGRSNSAPDSYEWQTNGRQVSVDTSLPPLTEVSVQEVEVEKR